MNKLFLIFNISRYFLLVFIIRCAFFYETTRAETIGESIYQIEKNENCQEIGQLDIEEASHLFEPCRKKPISISKDVPQINLMRDVVESIVFEKLAKDEQERLQCQILNYQHLISNPKLLDQALEQSCKVLPTLEAGLQNDYYHSEQLNNFENVLNNKELTLSLEKRSSLLEQRDFHLNQVRETKGQIAFITSHDVLLSNPFVFEKLERSVIGIGSGKKSNESLCEFLKRTAKEELNKSLKDISHIEDEIEKNLKIQSLNGNKNLKKYLWATPGRENYFTDSSSPSKLKNVYCMLEGQYGYGAKRVNDLIEAGLFLGSLIIPESRLRVVGEIGLASTSTLSKVLSKAPNSSWWTAKDFFKYEMLLAKSAKLPSIEAASFLGLTSIAVKRTINECTDELNTIKSIHSCTSNPKIFLTNFEKIQGANKCILTAAISAITFSESVAKLPKLKRAKIPKDNEIGLGSKLDSDSDYDSGPISKGVSSPITSPVTSPVRDDLRFKNYQYGEVRYNQGPNTLPKTFKLPKADPVDPFPVKMSEIVPFSDDMRAGLMKDIKKHVGQSEKAPNGLSLPLNYSETSYTVKSKMALISKPNGELFIEIVEDYTDPKFIGTVSPAPSAKNMLYFPVFQRKMGIELKADGKTLIRPANAQTYNTNIARYNQEMPDSKKIPIRVVDDFSKTGFSDEEVISHWVKGEVFLNQTNPKLHFHDNTFHIDGFLHLPKLVWERSSQNMKQVQDLLNSPLFRENSVLKAAIYQNFGSLIDRGTPKFFSSSRYFRETWNNLILDPLDIKKLFLRVGLKNKAEIDALNETLAKFKPALTTQEAQAQFQSIRDRME